MCLLTKLKKESKGKEVIESASAAFIWLALEYCMATVKQLIDAVQWIWLKRSGTNSCLQRKGKVGLLCGCKIGTKPIKKSNELAWTILDKGQINAATFTLKKCS